jgi:site-specific DNA-methyltransferase (adenine-specific)
MEANTIDAVVTDPPYGLKFMGLRWDCQVPGVDVWAALLAACKPGAHMLAFGGTRTFHRLAVAIEDAGWELRDTVMWVYGSGFPKSMDVSKAIDRAAGKKRRLGAKKVSADGTIHHEAPGRRHEGYQRPWQSDPAAVARNTCVSYPATAAAKRWQGWGSALKPGWEPILLCRKPLDGTLARNVQRWGVGALNIDGCRVAANGETPSIDRREAAKKSGRFGLDMHSRQRVKEDLPPFNRSKEDYIRERAGESIGRFPANLIHDGSDEVLGLFPPTISGGWPTSRKPGGYYGGFHGQKNLPGRKGSIGSAARFFYCAKASRRERGEGNSHPTVKPLALIEYLLRLITRPGQLVIDPFAGSGTTLVACARLGRQAVGIEREAAYCRIARRRLQAVTPLAAALAV